MKILFVANQAEFGGAPKCMLELIELLTTQYGVDVHVITHGEGVIAKWCKQRDIIYYPIGHVPGAIGRGSTMFRKIVKFMLLPFYYLRAVSKNKKAIKMAEQIIDLDSFDYIHTNSNRDIIGAELSRRHNMKHIWHLREFGAEDYDIRYLVPNYISYMNNNTNVFIAISEAVRIAWIEKGLDADKIVKIYDGIHLPNGSIIKLANERMKDNLKNLRGVFLGLVCPAKGQLELVKALSLVDKGIINNIHVDFWGDEKAVPEYTKAILDYAEKNGIAGNIRFCGFSDNIWDKLVDYNTAFVCSRSEAFGRITPEYMSIGIITIAANTGSNPELIENNISGFIYKRESSEDLAQKISALYYMNREQKEQIRLNAISRASEFSDEKNASNIYNLYVRY